MLNKRKKATKMRGSKTHGGGSMKKRRGAGHRGGRGNAGTGKRGDAMKPSVWKNPRYLSRHGFSSIKKSSHTLNIANLESQFLAWQQQGLITAHGDRFAVDLSSLGFDKLLSKGSPTRKYLITISHVSASAKGKIEAAGGSITSTPETQEDTKSA